MTTAAITSAISHVSNLTLDNEKEKLTPSLDSTPNQSSCADTTPKYYNNWPNDQGVRVPQCVAWVFLGLSHLNPPVPVSYSG